MFATKLQKKCHTFAAEKKKTKIWHILMNIIIVRAARMNTNTSIITSIL